MFNRQQKLGAALSTILWHLANYLWFDHMHNLHVAQVNF